MTRSPKKVLSGDYKVGYGRPPAETRFRKGVCGNPGGRPRGMTAGRAKRLALQEAYRPITVREGDEVFTLPTIQAVMRQQGRLAAKGNGPAQRAVIGMVHAIEQEALQAATAATEGTETPGSSNFSFSVGVVNLAGRGLDVDVSAFYNARLWNRLDLSGTEMNYDVDQGWPAPGFTRRWAISRKRRPTSKRP